MLNFRACVIFVIEVINHTPELLHSSMFLASQESDSLSEKFGQYTLAFLSRDEGNSVVTPVYAKLVIQVRNTSITLYYC